MSSGLQLSTNQTDQRRCRDGDERDRDQTGRQNVPETIHHDKSDILRIHRRPKLREDDYHILV